MIHNNNFVLFVYLPSKRESTGLGLIPFTFSLRFAHLLISLIQFSMGKKGRRGEKRATEREREKNEKIFRQQLLASKRITCSSLIDYEPWVYTRDIAAPVSHLTAQPNRPHIWWIDCNDEEQLGLTTWKFSFVSSTWDRAHSSWSLYSFDSFGGSWTRSPSDTKRSFPFIFLPRYRSSHHLSSIAERVCWQPAADLSPLLSRLWCHFATRFRLYLVVIDSAMDTQTHTHTHVTRQLITDWWHKLNRVNQEMRANAKLNRFFSLVKWGLN